VVYAPPQSYSSSGISIVLTIKIRARQHPEALSAEALLSP